MTLCSGDLTLSGIGRLLVVGNCESVLMIRHLETTVMLSLGNPHPFP